MKNYFELYDMPIQLSVDKKDLPKKYFELNRIYHPDFFIHESAKKRAEVLYIAAQINRAFKIFQSTDDTIKYVLKLKGLLEEEEKYQLPPDYLMEVMEINEALMDGTPKEDIKPQIEQLQTEIYEPIKQIVEGYQEGITTEKELLQVKEYYYKKKYLDRIRRQLNEMT